jgi:mRNA interferase MazF
MPKPPRASVTALKSREKVRAHRRRLRRRGLRPVQLWVPDVRSDSFVSEARRQSRLIVPRPSSDGPQPRRGEIWAVSLGSSDAAAARYAIILQDNAFDATGAVTICLSSVLTLPAPLLRVAIEPSPRNGLNAATDFMIDKLTTISRPQLTRRIGSVADEEMAAITRAIVVFLGLAGRSGPPSVPAPSGDRPPAAFA